jgi:hypothetical protein
LAKSAARKPKSVEGGPIDVAAKAKAAAQRAAGLRADLANALSLVHQAQLREALTRTELTLALTEALKARAAAEAAARRQIAARFFEGAQARAVRRRSRFTRLLDRLRLRLGRLGQTGLIVAHGVWREDDVAAIADYVRRGADPTAQPATLFDQAWHLATYPEVAASGLSPLVYYLTQGAAAGHSPHPLLHHEFYRSKNARALGDSQATPLEHFVRAGAAGGRDPHPLFDLTHYATQGPQLGEGEDPVSHYLRAGWRDGLSPHPLFDSAWYRRQMPRRDAEVAPLVHYLTVGWPQGLSPHPLFDPRWYVAQNPDVAEAGTEPLTHFLASGAAEGRSPSPWFDLPHYVAARGAALDPAANPLVDYLQGGAWEIAEARPGFPTAAYLASHPEVVSLAMTPLDHWARQGASKP